MKSVMTDKSAKSSEKEQRQQRLQKALRENLFKRKTQMRERQAASLPDEATDAKNSPNTDKEK